MIALYEYQSYATAEFPDVLIVGNCWTILFEIKTSRSDFLADANKSARRKWDPKGYAQIVNYKRIRSCGSFCPIPKHGIISIAECKNCDYYEGKTKHYNKQYQEAEAVKCTYNSGAILKWISENPELYYIEKPHLGNKRYFVCADEIIRPDDLPEGWGLYWYNGGKFFLKQESKKWRSNVFEERNIIAHAFRRWVSGDHTGILVNAYGTMLGERCPTPGA